jgi:hypothetical protein
MKKIALFFTLISIGISITAQDKLPSFGKIDKADLEMKDCSFDPGAEAIVLINVGEIQFAYLEGIGGQSESSYRVRIKILKASAISPGKSRADIKMVYYTKNRNEDITNISGVSFNLDNTGNIAETKLEKKAIYDKPVNKEFSEISFALPDVKVGTVFEYKYKKIKKSFGYIPDWNFQQRIPVKYSAYNIIIPQYYQFTIQTTKRQEMEQKHDKSIGSTWYIMRNVPGLKSEPYSSGFSDYIQRVEFQLSKIDAPGYYQEIRTTWKKIIDELVEDEDFGLAIKKNIKGTGDLNAELESTKSTKDKIRKVYNYVQRNMQWNDEYSRYTDNGTKDAWDKKNGNITDINFILIRLLRDADIEAKPLLVSTKNNGAVNTFYPFLNQFNGVMVYVKDGEDRYIMNAADKLNPYNIIPDEVLATNGLVVDKEEGGIIGLNNSNKFLNNIFFTASATADGKFAGQSTLNSSGYARPIRMDTYKKGKLKTMLEENEGITIKVDSITVNNLKDETLPLEQKVEFTGNMQSSGEYYFLPCSIFTGLGKNPFIAEERVMDIDFTYPKSYIISGSYILPDEFVVNELPKNTRMILPDTSIVLTRMIQNDNNIISFRFTIDFKTQGYTADSYPYIKEFFKKMYEIIDERIVLKKK